MRFGDVLRSSLVRSFLKVGAMRLLSIPVGLVASIILARALGPEAFGRYAFVMALIPLLALPVAAGLPQLLTREAARYSQSGSWGLYHGGVRTAHLWVIAVSGIIVASYFLGGHVVGLWPTVGKWSLLGLAIFMIPLTGLNAVRNGAIKGLGHPALAELPSQLIQPVLVLTALGGVYLSGALTERTAILSQLAAASATLVFATCLFLKVSPKRLVQVEHRLGHWFYALLPFTLIGFVSTFNNQVGIVLLGVIGSDESVAAMRVAERGAQFVLLSLSMVNLVISPPIVRAHRSGDQERLQQLSRNSARLSLMIALPIGVLLIGFGKPVISLAFGEDYVSISYVPLVILVCAQIINIFFGSVGQLLSMSGYEKDTLKGQVIAIIVNISLCYILIPRYGAVGASIAVSTGIVTWNVLLAILVWKRLNIRPTAL